jgi:uncharacterized Ntn-hydrolase superfamily protein
MYFSTFSVVARDPESGYIAVAGTSNGFAYGSIVPHIEAGVGAIATQAIVNLNYAAEGMLDLREGLSATDAMVELLRNDPDTDGLHQVLIIDNQGNTACHTGENNYDTKGHISKMNFACAGNTLVNEDTLKSMTTYFEQSNEPFALKVIRTLQAGHEAGGDIRGIKSAAIKIVTGRRHEKFWEGVVMDLRTDENKSPLEKLERLYIMSQANIYSNKGLECKDTKESLAYFEKALELSPDNPEYMLWVAKRNMDLGNESKTNELLEKIKTYPGHWMEYWERLMK